MSDIFRLRESPGSFALQLALREVPAMVRVNLWDSGAVWRHARCERDVQRLADGKVPQISCGIQGAEHKSDVGGTSLCFVIPVLPFPGECRR